jgi:FAD:protein FMN transferase
MVKARHFVGVIMALGASDGLDSVERAKELASGGWYVHEAAIMGTAIKVELWSENAAQGERAINAVMTEMRRIDCAMSPHKPDSELSRINAQAAFAPVILSSEMAHLVARALEFHKLSEGAFDITYAAVGQLYDYRARVQPTPAELVRACAAVGSEHLIFEPSTRQLRFAREGVRIDLGGFAKGHAVNSAAALLKQHGIAHAMVSAGGDSRVLGDRRGRPWTVAIRDPRRAGEVVAVLPLEDVSISTSGDYERYFEHEGVRHHHLLDPRTGQSPRSVRSVTVLADDGLMAEAASKSVFVMGVKKGLQWVHSLQGVDAVVVDSTGHLHFSEGLLQGHSLVEESL